MFLSIFTKNTAHVLSKPVIETQLPTPISLFADQFASRIMSTLNYFADVHAFLLFPLFDSRFDPFAVPCLLCIIFLR